MVDFNLINSLGNIDDEEMHRVFNMGVGLVIIAPPGYQSQLASALAPFDVWKLGWVDGAINGVFLDKGAA